MRRLLFLFLAGVLAGGLLSLSCAATPAFTSQRLADGSYQLQCTVALSSCLDRIDEVCLGTPYDVLSAHDHRKTNDIAVGNTQSELRSSDAIVRCVRNKPLFGGTAVPPPPPPAEAMPPAPAIPVRACVPGLTQACVGLGACSGGQACLPDGSGFGPCNCGGGSPAVDAGVN